MTFEAPRLAADKMSIPQLCRLYRILDNLEETTNMAHEYVRYIDGSNTVSEYVNQLQEYISSERGDIITALRARPASDDREGVTRLATILQYEAWCEEFYSTTVAEFALSSLAQEAV